MPRGLSNPARPAERGSTCRAIGCRALVLPCVVFCERHDAMLQSDVKIVLGKTFRLGRKVQSKVFDLTLARAREEILFAQTTGHRMPRDGDFEW